MSSKVRVAFVFLSMALGLVTAVHGDDAVNSNGASSNAKLEARLAELEKRVASLEMQVNANTSRAPAATQPVIAGMAKPDGKGSPLILDDWDYSVTQGEFGQSFYKITLKLRNAGTKPIKLIDASVQFSDLLDAHLYGIKVTPDKEIGVGKVDSDEGQYEINPFINEQSRMRNMKQADIKASLEVKRIVFVDNTVLTLDD